MLAYTTTNVRAYTSTNMRTHTHRKTYMLVCTHTYTHTRACMCACMRVCVLRIRAFTYMLA